MNPKFKVGDNVIVKARVHFPSWQGTISQVGQGGVSYEVRNDDRIWILPESDLTLAPKTFTELTKIVFPGGTQETQYLVSRFNDTPAPSCNHSWSLYRGISQQFEYCTKCDEKRAHKGLYDK